MFLQTLLIMKIKELSELLLEISTNRNREDFKIMTKRILKIYECCKCQELFTQKKEMKLHTKSLKHPKFKLMNRKNG